MKPFKETPYEPVNAQEHFMHACMIRLDALCHMMDSLIEHIAKRDGVATTQVTETISVVEEIVEPVKKTRKSTKK